MIPPSKQKPYFIQYKQHNSIIMISYRHVVTNTAKPRVSLCECQEHFDSYEVLALFLKLTFWCAFFRT